MRDETDRSPAGETAAERLVRAARAAQQLCDVLWESLLEELRNPDAERVRALSERLVEVSSTVAMLAATHAGVPVEPHTPPPEAPPVGAGTPSAEITPAGGRPPAAAPSVVEPPTPPATPAAERRTPPPATPPAERPVPQPQTRPEPKPVELHPISSRANDYTFTKLVDERNASASTEQAAPEIEIRDVRREEGPSAWVSSVGRLLQRHSEDGLPFAVLLVEIVDVARLERSETQHDMHGLVAQVESALGRGMRATDRLSRESLGRYWLVAPETNGTGARMLAERLARLVRTSASHRGVPLEVAIGVAVCPDDGTEAPALAARADLGVYSARATGRSVAHTDPPPAR